MSGIYVHIPYCRRKCIYCDFYSAGGRQADWPAFVGALLSEMRVRADETEDDFKTFYLGGGTPSLLPPEELARLMRGIREIAGRRWKVVEATIEVNPEDVSADACRRWVDAGITRVSMGVQSLVDEELRALGRRHDSRMALDALGTLLGSGMDVSVDIMFALPGQTHETLSRTLDGILPLRPHHFSAYALMFEPGTAMTYLRDAGRFSEADEQTYADLYGALRARLREEGYEHYEISNYALPGHRSRHNSGYWDGTPYLGLGPAAHSYDGATVRRSNPADIARYLRHDFDCGQFFEAEHLDAEMLQEEYLLTRLRRSEGFSLADFESRFGRRAAGRLRLRAEKERAAGLLAVSEGRVSLTEAAMLVSDSVILSLSV